MRISLALFSAGLMGFSVLAYSQEEAKTSCNLADLYQAGACVDLSKKYDLSAAKFLACDPALGGEALRVAAGCAPKFLPSSFTELDREKLNDNQRTELEALSGLGDCQASGVKLTRYVCLKTAEESSPTHLSQVREDVKKAVKTTQEIKEKAEETPKNKAELKEQVKQTVKSQLSLPSLPSLPSVPSVPAVPSVPSLPSHPSAPSATDVEKLGKKVEEKTKGSIQKIKTELEEEASSKEAVPQIGN